MPTNLTVRKPEDFAVFPLCDVFQCIHQKIEQQVQIFPNKTAISSRDAKYTYAQMNGFANSLAEVILAKQGTELGQVATLLPNTPDLIGSLLAALKAHKAYVPLDCNFPKARLRAMMNDSEAGIVLTDRAHFALAEELCAGATKIIDIGEIDRHAETPNPKIKCEPSDRAYILYTSGTTGRPKGIVFVHRNLLHTTMCLTNELFYSPSDRVSWLHSPSFGSSIVDIYNCLTSGATLFPWDTKTQGFTGMADWIDESHLTAFHWVPSAFRQFFMTVTEGRVFKDVRIVVMGGETLTIREVELFRRHFPVGSHLVNQVGTAESYNYHLYRVDHQIPIEGPNVAGGYSVSADRRLLILDESHSEVKRGVTGEIAIKSNYMSAGYWHNDELTKTKFITLQGDETPVYLTGDLGKVDETGCLIHLGRRDFQFKIRGCRVELSEIDQLLVSAPGVKDAITWVHKNRRDEEELVGYIVPLDEGQLEQEQIERHLGQQLPAYMIPRHYVRMSTLPLLPTGKTDRNSLPNPFASRERDTQALTDNTQPIISTIVAIFKQLLRTEEIDAGSDFYEEGGDSLLAAVLIHHLDEQFKVEVSPDDLIGNVTPERLALLIGSNAVGGCRTDVSARRSYRARPVSKPKVSTEPHARGLIARDIQCPGYHMTQNLIIIGAGQSGREVYTWALQSIDDGTRLRIKGFLDDRSNALNGYIYDVGVLGTARDYEIEPGDVFIGAIGNPVTKTTCCRHIIEKGGQFINIIHPLANIGKNVELGTGIVLAPFTSITVDAKIGSHVSIGTFSNVAHDTVVGDFAQISSHCGLNGTAMLGEGAFLGSHVCILPGVNVGAWAYVGAGSVVVRHVEDGAKVFGNPAGVIGRNDALSGETLLVPLKK